MSTPGALHLSFSQSHPVLQMQHSDEHVAVGALPGCTLMQMSCCKKRLHKVVTKLMQRPRAGFTGTAMSISPLSLKLVYSGCTTKMPHLPVAWYCLPGSMAALALQAVISLSAPASA